VTPEWEDGWRPADTVDGYAIPADPMDELQCDSCQ
jgi:hypothetical protein